MSGLSIFRICKLRGLAFVLAQLSLAALTARAQTDACRQLAADAGYIVHSIKVEARWTPSLKQLDLADLIGQPYSQQIDQRAQRKVQDALETAENRAIESRLLGVLSVLYVTSCVKADDAKKAADVIIRPFYLRIDQARVGGNLLLIPRSLLPTFYESVPRPLLVFDPKFSLTQDRAFGLAPSLSLNTDLLSLPQRWRNETPAADATALELKAIGRKSLNEPFYQSAIELALTRFKPTPKIESLSFAGTFAAEQTPIGIGRRARNAGEFGGSIQLRPRLAILDRLALASRYRWSRNRSSNENDLVNERTTERAFAARVLTDGQLAGGAWRAAAWFEAAAPKTRARSLQAYQRLAFTVGYAAELGRGHQTVGVELLAGGGRAWGNVPNYARFYGGNAARNFLYESFDAPLAQAFPAGPLIRSLGEARANPNRMTQGGTAYWHANLNVALPLPKLSYPLIPAIKLPNSDGTETPLNQRIKKIAVNSSLGFITNEIFEELVAEFKRQGMSDDEAEAKAEPLADQRARQIVKRDFERPIGFVTDKANIFAIKPLLMFDAGRLAAPDTMGTTTRLAFGGGLQFTLVVAKFEIGYLRTLQRQPGDQRGNLVARLVIQNLF